MRRNSNAPPITAAAFLLLPFLYCAGYFSLVDMQEPRNYRVGQQTTARVFWPAEQIDRYLRTGYWGHEFDQRRPPQSARLELYDPTACDEDITLVTNP